MARLQELLRSEYPAVFKIPPVVPLAHGVHRQIAEEQGLSLAEVRSALAFWINGLRYITAIARGGARYGLDGKPDGVVTDAEAAEARERLAVRKPRHPGGKHNSVQHAAE
jgi:ProP effector